MTCKRRKKEAINVPLLDLKKKLFSRKRAAENELYKKSSAELNLNIYISKDNEPCSLAIEFIFLLLNKLLVKPIRI